MFKIKGKYSEALVTTLNIEIEAVAQINALVNHPASIGSNIAIMPDVHAGVGSVVGTTMTISDRVVPNLVGVDIGCGVLAIEVPKDIDFIKLQDVIDKYIPSGMGVHQSVYHDASSVLSGLITPVEKSIDRIMRSIGTLGGGNHFISIEGDEYSNFLIIHTGSRNLGVKVAKFHQEIAKNKDEGDEAKNLIERLKSSGKTQEIQSALEKLKKESAQNTSSSKELSFLQGQAMKDYLNDIDIAQRFAALNRAEIARIICSHMGWNIGESIESVHNYIDVNEMILRKGAISCRGKFLIPLNMRDGTLIGEGIENPEWNHSAPHGAGRAMSRSRAKRELSLDDFKNTMKGIWSSSVKESTLDEAPEAYKPADEIKQIVSSQYKVVRHLKPLFNFKAN